MRPAVSMGKRQFHKPLRPGRPAAERARRFGVALLFSGGLFGCRDKLPKGSAVTPVYSPKEALKRFRLVDGYHMELVAAEPIVQDPVAIDFDADGRMYVVEMRGFMPNVQGIGEDQPVGRIVVAEDTDGDGIMDKTTIFADSLVLPRAVKVLEHGVLVGAPPNLWLMRDTTGDLKADTRELIRDDFGDPKGNPEHNANGLFWGIDNWIHTANYPGQFRVGPDGKIVFRKTADEGQWGVAADDYGRLYRNSNEDPLRADLIASQYAMRNAALPSLRGVYERLTANIAVWPDHKTPAINRGYRDITMRKDSSLAHYTSAGSPTPYVGDRLPAELKDVLVPSLILQPIVENAVEHGLQGRIGSLTVEINVRRDDDALLVAVRDNGPGFPSSGPTEGIGLANTRGRLEHIYGQASRFTYGNSPTGGAVVQIRIPFRRSAMRAIA